MSEAKKILIVDDEEEIRTLFSRVLSRAGYEILLAEDAQQALLVLRERAVDLVLLDLHMPGLVDGEDMLVYLRDQGEEVPIVVVSGWVDDEATILPPGAVEAVLKKPIKIDQMVDTVRQLLN
jgi:DNA-binding NtrC family response regulator